jgi:DNA-binding response OmpR family regulator
MAEFLPLTVYKPRMMALEIIKALIVDDDADVCLLLKKVLSINNIHAATAHNLRQARQCLQEVQPQLVLLDNNLPDGNGVDFIKQVRAFDDSIKIIMITGDLHDGLKEEAIFRGAHSFLPKPFDLRTVLQEVNTLISGPSAQ